MARLLTLCLGLLIALSVAMGSVAHAAEPEGSFTLSTATSVLVALDHGPGDSDQVPADADKGYPHHHGGCHGHHELTPVDEVAIPVLLATGGMPFLHEAPFASTRPSGPDFRPPRA